jgi:hypothetical protein
MLSFLVPSALQTFQLVINIIVEQHAMISFQMVKDGRSSSAA